MTDAKQDAEQQQLFGDVPSARAAEPRDWWHDFTAQADADTRIAACYRRDVARLQHIIDTTPFRDLYGAVAYLEAKAAWHEASALRWRGYAERERSGRRVDVVKAKKGDEAA